MWRVIHPKLGSNVFYSVDFSISYIAWCKENLVVASHTLCLTWCFQGLRDAINNGDIAAVKKLFNEVYFFQMMHLYGSVFRGK